MTKLQVSTFIPAGIEEVYTFVTAYDSEGVSDQALFTKKHGDILKSEANILTTKDSQDGYDLTWRCAFEFPIRRSMEAIDSNWANRTDSFTTTNSGTQWTIIFETKRGGLAGGVQALFFYLFTRKRVYQSSIAPVIHHFSGTSYP